MLDELKTGVSLTYRAGFWDIWGMLGGAIESAGLGSVIARRCSRRSNPECFWQITGLLRPCGARNDELVSNIFNYTRMSAIHYRHGAAHHVWAQVARRPACDKMEVPYLLRKR
ncbi:MAG: hypothetical protein KGJ19_09965 [Betaproteobacteria bacterium]|nr:hypothetical protein [Betaproteobacteria bacterium]